MSRTRLYVLICLGMAFAIVWVYFPVRSFGFLDYDDNIVFLDNPYVRDGLTWRGIVWGAKTSYYEYWHPLMWYSHMLDCSLFGLNAGWHHMENLAFHVLNTLLVFAVLQEMTGKIWRSAAVAALFGLHPLHVESVAWLAERKDLLAAFFWLLSVWAYVRCVRVGQGHKCWRKWHVLALILFALGLMSKPMVVTLPFALLLLDFWPLGRFTGASSLAGLIKEKSLFFVLAAGASAITFLTVKAGNHVLSSSDVSWDLRLENIPVSYVRYLGKIFWPAKLVVFYPMPGHWPVWQVVASLTIISLVTMLALVYLRRAGYLVFGWFIFLGTLVPTIGLVSVGFQSIADRYMYLPSIGLFVALVWGIAELTGQGPQRALVLGATTFAALIACGVAAREQVGSWSDSVTLWTHCLEAGAESPIAHYNLGHELLNSGQLDEAMTQFKQTLALDPVHVDATMDLGVASAHHGQLSEATNWLMQAVRLNPEYPKARVNLGLAMLQLGDADGAERQCVEALRVDSNNAGAYTCLGIAQGAQGRSEEAMTNYTKALSVDPEFAQARLYLGKELVRRGRFGGAVSNLFVAVRLLPQLPEAQLQFAIALAGNQDFEKALSAAQRAEELAIQHGDTNLAEQGRQLQAQLRQRPAVHLLN